MYFDDNGSNLICCAISYHQTNAENCLLYRHISCRLQTVLDNISHSIEVMRRVFLLYLIIHKAYNKHVWLTYFRVLYAQVDNALNILELFSRRYR